MRKNKKYILIKKNDFKKIFLFKYKESFDMSKKKDKERYFHSDCFVTDYDILTF